MDVNAEREKITQEIKELERILDPGCSGFDVDVSESSLVSDSDADSLPDGDSDAAGPLSSEEERWDDASNDEDDPKEKTLPEDPETCLQLNMVYQEVIREKLAEVSLLLAQNREQQEEVMWDLAGSKGPKVKDGKTLPLNLYVGHFLKPYFKDKVTGVGPPANEDAREKAAQGIKTFEELLVTKWKSWEKALLRKSVVSDRLQRLLQPKLLKLEYLQQKQSKVTSEEERQVLRKQSGEAEREIRDINQLPEEALLGSRLDSHDWEKISNINFEGTRGAEEIRKFWQNWEHPSINKQEWTGQEVDRLKAIAAKHDHLHWQKIAEELGTRRSAFQCLQQYQRHNRALKRREWTEEEDRMLAQLVQEMRVGSHIPYRRIVYYMEGRDSMQLTYRWTKSLDPSLRKGLWTPEEDAKLLQAVAKYGEQDWFKIREEVPGRSDAQCRDRYLRRLHRSLKKGRWSSEEEERLAELIEKHGAGHWEKIASELPHRTGSQCLSKWKVMVRRQHRGRRRRRLCTVQRSSSSEGGSSGGSSRDSSRGHSKDSGDSEPEEAPGAQKAGQSLPSAQHTVPDMDLWVPARQSASALRGPWGSAASPRPPSASSVAQGSGREVEAVGRQAPSGTHGASLRGVGHPHGTDTHPTSSEELADENGRCLLKVPLETVLRVLRTSTASRGRPRKEKLQQPCLPGSPPGTTPGGSAARPPARQLWQRHRKHALQGRLLQRRLLVAVSPWVGDIVLPSAAGRPSAAHTRADGIRAQLQDACLASTPVFTLFIQLFQIDTAGCMEVVLERKAQLPALAQAGPQEPSSAQSTPGCPLSSVPAPDAAEKSTSHRGRRGQQTCRAEAASRAPPPAPCGPRPKPKTVSELLREKRLREARASKVAQGPGAPAAATPSPDGGPPVLQALAVAPVPTVASEVPASCHQSSLRQSQAPAPAPKQGLPEVPPFLPVAASPALLPVQPLSLMPALGSCEGGPHAATSTPLSVTWVLTAQGLLPVPMPAVVGLPRPAGPPDPQGLAVTLSPSLAETPAGQGPATTDTEPGPPPGTDLETLAPPPPSQTPAGVHGDSAPAPGGLSSPGKASQAAVLAEPPEAASPQSSQLPPHCGASPGNGPGRTPLPPSEPGQTRAPLEPERPHPPQLGPTKSTLDLSLLSLESEMAVREWLGGQRGVCVPPLGSRLPYQPPTLCSLQALSRLLLHKKALEHRAASLVPGGAAGALQASLGRVHRQLRDSPAYLLLKARFLAAFTLPALLATLPPPGVHTTLSATVRTDSRSEEEDLEELALLDGGGQAGGSAQAGPTATAPVQETPDPDKGSALSCPDDTDDLDVLRTRHGRHVRKRRRLL